MDDLSDVAKRVERIQILFRMLDFRLKGGLMIGEKVRVLVTSPYLRLFPRALIYTVDLISLLEACWADRLGGMADEEGRGR